MYRSAQAFVLICYILSQFICYIFIFDTSPKGWIAVPPPPQGAIKRASRQPEGNDSFTMRLVPPLSTWLLQSLVDRLEPKHGCLCWVSFFPSHRFKCAANGRSPVGLDCFVVVAGTDLRHMVFLKSSGVNKTNKDCVSAYAFTTSKQSGAQ